MEFAFWGNDPVQIWGVETTEGEPFDWMAEPFLNLLVANPGGVNHRGVSIERLATILRSGVDVEPADGVIYCELGDKAYEYGGFPKVILVLRYQDGDRQVMFPAVRTVAPDSSPDSIAEALALYPVELESDRAGRSVRCREQPESEAVRKYMGAYGYFIPEDPWGALVGIFVFGTQEHLDAARDVVRAHVAAVPNPTG